MATDPFTSLGKEVLRYGRHFADACTAEAAAEIATAMNAAMPTMECTCPADGAIDWACPEHGVPF